jgi:flavin-dependent dehydrogenase
VTNDVIIVGAGPAGAVAATVLARAGARVRLLDRAAFPRDKLCGDTVNPGTLALLRRLGLAASIEERGLPVHGMRVTGEHGVVIEGRYPRGQTGRALVRRDLDWALVAGAIAAGAMFEPEVAVRRAIADQREDRRSVAGVAVDARGAGGATRGRERELRARVIIAADGRRSTLAFGLGLARHADSPRRWAIGAYFENVATETTIDAETAEHAEDKNESLRVPRVLRGASVFGEMHVRRGRYIGVAPVPGALTNVCLVKPSGPGDPSLRDPASVLRQELARDPLLRDRFVDARLVQPPVLLGPLAVDIERDGIDGLLLAGDAAGFIDPMTGDGLRFAVRGGELAALAALDALEHGWAGVHDRLAARRRREFGGKWRFNRAVRALVASPRAVGAAARGATIAPGVLRAMIAYAGDCGRTTRLDKNLGGSASTNREGSAGENLEGSGG